VNWWPKTCSIILILLVICSYPAAVFAGEIYLLWDRNSEKDLAGYRIHFGTESGRYDQTIYVGKYTRFVVEDLEVDRRYYFVVTAIDYSGNESAYSREVNGIAVESADPRSESVLFTGPSYNFPNPFKAGNSTTIRYEITANANVSIKIYDLSNRLVYSLIDNEFKLAGVHTEDQWDGTNSFGDYVAQGIYLCRIDTGSQHRVIKIAVTK
jgi:hypothetical protein